MTSRLRKCDEGTVVGRLAKAEPNAQQSGFCKPHDSDS
jgi:hypothetical protein